MPVGSSRAGSGNLLAQVDNKMTVLIKDRFWPQVLKQATESVFLRQKSETKTIINRNIKYT
jgi:hypothetical protein